MKPSLKQLEEKALSWDVTFDINRYYSDELHEKDPEIIRIQKIGFRSAAATWLCSMDSKKYPALARWGSKFGKNPNQQERLEAAKHYANYADADISEIAKEVGLEHLIL